jgi:MarR family transcriptional regulator, organic hydroperoxide resistance regulator
LILKSIFWGEISINGDGLTNYIKELDHIFSRLIYRVRVLHNRYTVDEITDTQFIVLRSLRKSQCNTSYLAQMLGVTLSAVTALINRLHRMGLVSRERKEKDRRQVWISITPKGLKVLSDVEEKRNLLLALYLSHVPEKERQQLLELLRRAITLFEREDILEEDIIKL